MSEHAKESLPIDSSRHEVLAIQTIRRVCERHPAIWAALVLWVASNVFVHLVAKAATWEGEAKYFSASDLCQHDCGWYKRVLLEGYDKTPTADGGANWPFHPIFPLTAYPFHRWLHISPKVSLVVASKLALLLAIYAFLLLVGTVSDTPAERVFSGSLVAFNPYVIYAHAGYAEPLYFALLSLGFYLLQKREWVGSGMAGALISATRMIGFVFAVSYLTAWLRESRWRPNLRRSDQLLGLMLCPLGTVAFMLYLYLHTGDAFAQVHAEVAWGRSPGNPVQAFLEAYSYHHWPRVFAFMGIASLLASAYLFVRGKAELAVYLAVSILLSMTGGFFGLARYVWWQPPFLYAIYDLLKRHSAWWPVYTAFAAGLCAYMIIGWWMIGHFFVV